MDRSLEECTSLIYEDNIDMALIKIANANTILDVIFWLNVLK
jgi:hypothetical protein